MRLAASPKRARSGLKGKESRLAGGVEKGAEYAGLALGGVGDPHPGAG